MAAHFAWLPRCVCKVRQTGKQLPAGLHAAAAVLGGLTVDLIVPASASLDKYFHSIQALVFVVSRVGKLYFSIFVSSSLNFFLTS